MLTIAQVAETLGAKYGGNGQYQVAGLAEPATARATDLALAMSPRFAQALSDGAAQAAVVWADADWQALGLKAAIMVNRPRMALAQLTKMMDAKIAVAGIDATAVVDPTAQIGDGVGIGAFCVVGPDVIIGAGTAIGPHVTLAAGVKIGAQSALHAGVRIGRNVTLGNHVIVQSNTVIGADGFSYVTQEPNIADIGRKTLGKTPLPPITDATQHRIHALGGVAIDDNVEIGANSTIDAGTIRPTAVGSGTKIDNLVHLAHNVQVGRDCLLCGQVGVAGSSVIGDRCILAGQVGIADHITVGDDCLFGAGAGVLRNVPAGSFMMGYPAKPMLTFRAEQRALRDAPNHK